jgi:folate-dependent tRNA-U54 methylase TrmFO/GidA
VLQKANSMLHQQAMMSATPSFHLLPSKHNKITVSPMQGSYGILPSVRQEIMNQSLRALKLNEAA